MQQFTDTKGRTWHLSFTLEDRRRIRRELGVDLAEIFGESNAETIGKIFDDYEMLANVLWLLCQGQAEKQQVDAEEFARGLGGDVFADAADALVEAVVDFFPNANRRKALRGWLASVKNVQGQILERLAPAKLAELDDQVSNLTTEQLAKLLTG